MKYTQECILEAPKTSCNTKTHLKHQKHTPKNTNIHFKERQNCTTVCVCVDGWVGEWVGVGTLQASTSTCPRFYNWTRVHEYEYFGTVFESNQAHVLFSGGQGSL